jgi:hypothetical protein
MTWGKLGTTPVPDVAPGAEMAVLFGPVGSWLGEAQNKCKTSHGEPIVLNVNYIHPRHCLAQIATGRVPDSS